MPASAVAERTAAWHGGSGSGTELAGPVDYFARHLSVGLAVTLLEEPGLEHTLCTPGEPAREDIWAGASGTRPLDAMVARIAEDLLPGPTMARWLPSAIPGGQDGSTLAGMADAWHRLAAWATAGELATVAEMTARAAARDGSAGVGPDGRPDRVSDGAVAEVGLALRMSRFGAEMWADLGVTLSWRLPRTLAALSRGAIDLSRARLIAEAVSVLDDAGAAAVEDKVLAGAGCRTLGQLRADLRRAVISVDPAAAERRREEAERRASVGLYGDAEGTATLAGHNLPGGQAVAAMARVTALAQAMKAAGAGGGIDLLRAQVFIGLLLNTLPFIPPPQEDPGAPGPPDAGSPGPRDPDPAGPPGPGVSWPAGPDTSGPPAPSTSGSPEHQASTAPQHEANTAPDPRARGIPEHEASGPPAPGASGPLERQASDPRGQSPDGGWRQAGKDLPADGGQAPPDSGQAPPDSATPPAWPGLPARADVPSAGCPPGRRPGHVTMTVPWQTLAGMSSEPGTVCWLGPVTPLVSRQIAGAGADDPRTEWRVVLTSSSGEFICVSRIRRRSRPRAGPQDVAARGTPGGQRGAGLIDRITIIVPVDLLSHDPPWAFSTRHGPGRLAAMLEAALITARRAHAQTAAGPAHHADGPGACPHPDHEPRYRPSLRLRAIIVARDQTCRFPGCRQPAWHSDLDHSIPHHRGGPTCSCNLGSACRTHHRVKQERGWRLEQPVPGFFTWITPSGRRYDVTPDTYPT